MTEDWIFREIVRAVERVIVDVLHLKKRQTDQFVERAVACGVKEDEARKWCRELDEHIDRDLDQDALERWCQAITRNRV